MADELEEYGIKYRVVSLGEKQYMLLPVSLVKGYETTEGFATEEGILSYAVDESDYYHRFVVDSIFAKDELEYIYEYEGDDSFLEGYFFEDRKDIVFFVDARKKNGFMERSEINLRVLNDQDIDITFFMDKMIPTILLNEKALKEIQNCSDMKQVRLLLERYKSQIQSFKSFYEDKGITRVNVVNGTIHSVETDRSIVDAPLKVESPKPLSEAKHDVSYSGLRNYLKERIYGHDESMDTLSQKLYMNYTAEEGESVESILLVGPTGTGKTETVRAACEYLQIPFVETNASNIVPQGIKGMSIEDVIISLYEKAGCDIQKAQRGLIFLDEFDKLNDSDLDLKSSVKNILLTFTAGGSFPIDSNQYHFVFDSLMTNKIYAGVFDRIHQRKKTVGFGSNLSSLEDMGEDEEIRRKIVSQQYFTLEELSRISSVLGYNELDRETKKKILLSSKLSEFAKKRERYQRQFGVNLMADETYIDALLDVISQSETGMRSVNNLVKKTMNEAERALLENPTSYKRLILTRDTVQDAKKFDLS